MRLQPGEHLWTAPRARVHNARPAAPRPDDCFFNRAWESSSFCSLAAASSHAGHASFRGRRPAGAATSIGRIGSGCLASGRAWMRSSHLRLCPGSLVRTGRTAAKSCSLSDDHFVRRAPPSVHGSTWSRRSTLCGAPRRACGQPPPARADAPWREIAGHRSAAGVSSSLGRS